MLIPRIQKIFQSTVQKKKKRAKKNWILETKKEPVEVIKLRYGKLYNQIYAKVLISLAAIN